MLLRPDFLMFFKNMWLKDEEIKIRWKNENNYILEDCETTNNLLQTYNKIEENKKKEVFRIVKKYLTITNNFNDYINLSILNDDYSSFLKKNKIDIQTFYAPDFNLNKLTLENYSRQDKDDNVTFFMDFDINDLKITEEEKDLIIAEFLISFIYLFSPQSIFSFKILSISLYEDKIEENWEFNTYLFRGIFQDIKKYASIIWFILWYYKLKTNILKRYYFKSLDTYSKKIIKDLIKKDELTFEDFIRITKFKKQLILSTDLYWLTYHLNLINSDFFKEEKKFLDKFNLNNIIDILNFFYCFFYFNYKK